MIAERLLLAFHQERLKDLIQRVITALEGAAPVGLFDGVVRCRSLWDVACWALQETDDIEAQEASQAVFAQFAWGELSEVLNSELCIHAYYLGEETGPEWMPLPEKESLVAVIVARVSEAAAQRSLDQLERI